MDPQILLLQSGDIQLNPRHITQILKSLSKAYMQRQEQQFSPNILRLKTYYTHIKELFTSQTFSNKNNYDDFPIFNRLSHFLLKISTIASIIHSHNHDKPITTHMQPTTNQTLRPKVHCCIKKIRHPTKHVFTNTQAFHTQRT